MMSQSSILALTGVSGLALIIFCAPASIVHKTSVDTEICCRSRGKCDRRRLTERIKRSQVPPWGLAKGVLKYQKIFRGR